MATASETNDQGNMELLEIAPIRLSRNMTLRPLRASDAEDMARHANNRNVAANLRDRFPHPYSIEDAHSFLGKVVDPKGWLNSGPGTGQGADTVWKGPLAPAGLAITIDDNFIGSIGFQPGQDVHRRAAEVGFWIAEEHWGKGIMSEVLPVFVAWVWRTFDQIVRLEGYNFSWNPKSGRVFEKSGFEYVGLKKSYAWKHGRLGDADEWGLVRDELKH